MLARWQDMTSLRLEMPAFMDCHCREHSRSPIAVWMPPLGPRPPRDWKCLGSMQG